MVIRPLNTSTTIAAEVVSDVRCGSSVGGSDQSRRKTPPGVPVSAGSTAAEDDGSCTSGSGACAGSESESRAADSLDWAAATACAASGSGLVSPAGTTASPHATARSAIATSGSRKSLRMIGVTYSPS